LISDFVVLSGHAGLSATKQIRQYKCLVLRGFFGNLRHFSEK